MDRRDWLTRCAWGAVAALPGGFGSLALGQETPEEEDSGLKITDVRTILTAPADIRLVVVKVLTNEPELYGLGCATFTQRARVVETAVDQYLKPFLIGKDPTRIEDIWQSSFYSSYWRNGPVLNNAISGVDMALWDILGKRAGLPLYQLMGGKSRRAVDVYRHASGNTFEAVEDQVRSYMEQGYRHVRVQATVPGLATYGARGRSDDDPVPVNRRTRVWEPKPYVRMVPQLFEHLRTTVGEEVELLHDVHERIPPILALQLCKDLEPYRLFFLEDPLSPEDIGYFKLLRQQTSTPLAMGELFNNPHEWTGLVHCAVSSALAIGAEEARFSLLRQTDLSRSAQVFQGNQPLGVRLRFLRTGRRRDSADFIFPKNLGRPAYQLRCGSIAVPSGV